MFVCRMTLLNALGPSLLAAAAPPAGDGTIVWDALSAAQGRSEIEWQRSVRRGAILNHSDWERVLRTEPLTRESVQELVDECTPYDYPTRSRVGWSMMWDCSGEYYSITFRISRGQIRDATLYPGPPWLTLGSYRRSSIRFPEVMNRE